MVKSSFLGHHQSFLQLENLVHLHHSSENFVVAVCSWMKKMEETHVSLNDDDVDLCQCHDVGEHRKQLGNGAIDEDFVVVD
ncbi:hypothetical protein MtrunA17_Chr1g0179571 [Medicago truncatula]|uniref:Uncharacterized protein n=1 Tax=Medicago truncatula TaxID=3880 RepID=A0A396JTU3_MEDTR|nr:hypothetical protein MtrunA17_Chr1g0179571 [Medicago truncatula]